jgi:hypothetical protein
MDLLTKYQDLLTHVTKVTYCFLTGVHPFEILTQCLNTKKANFVCMIHLTAPPGNHLDHSKLTKLTILGESFSHNSFKLLFSSFTALAYLHFSVKSVPDFDEDDFVHFLENKLPVSKLKSLIISDLPTEMTGKSMCALLQNSNLEELVNFCKIEFSETEMEVLKNIAQNRGMEIIPL